MAGWSKEDVELFIKQSYNQINNNMMNNRTEEMIKVETNLSLSIVEMKTYEVQTAAVTQDYYSQEAEQFDDDEDYVGNQMDDDYSSDSETEKKSRTIKFCKTKSKKKKKWGKFLKNSKNSGTCEYCHKEFKRLKVHKYDVHFDILKSQGHVRSRYPQDCQDCGANLKNSRAKVKHKCPAAVKTIEVKEENGNNTEEFICHLCGIHCPSKSSLSNHLQQNCGNVCEICKEILPNKTEVKQHMFLVHKKIKTSFHKQSVVELNHQCDQCHKKFASSATLSRHIKRHEEAASKKQCPDCGNLFSSSAALRKHMSLHKPPEIPCPVCGKLFHNQTYLMRHASTVHADTEDKKYKCDVCGKGFTNKIALDGHHNWHYNLKPYQCRWCDRVYQNQSNCNAHERKSHKTEYQAILTNKRRKIQVNAKDSVDPGRIQTEMVF